MMRLEISVSNYKHNSKSMNQLHHHQHKNSIPVMETEAISGTKLLHVLNEWQDNLNVEQLKKSCDYEI
ncbi:hypothetical protein RhiirB3_405034 [Rhizophagus irregularis]|nr:hypothetical protein RhiirB3_405034 [Rhizophagus irregularis]